jgi:hypothetical protein
MRGLRRETARARRDAAQPGERLVGVGAPPMLAPEQPREGGQIGQGPREPVPWITTSLIASSLTRSNGLRTSGHCRAVHDAVWWRTHVIGSGPRDAPLGCPAMAFGRKKRASRDRDPFVHLAEERRAAESATWFLEPDDGPVLDIQTGISSNLSQEDLDDPAG